MNSITIISTIIIIIATLFNLYLTLWKYLQQTSVIDIKIDNLPPYPNEKEKTVITLKNVGLKKTKKNLNVTLSCSWLSGISYKLEFPSESYFLAPNEEISWKIRINDNIPENSNIRVNVRTPYGTSWDLHEQIS